MRAALINAVIVGTAAAAPSTRPAISIYPRVTPARGTQTIELDVVDHTAQPIAVCANEWHCLALEIKDAHGAWVAWQGPIAPPLPMSAKDFVVIPPQQQRVVFALPVTRTGSTRDFQIGVAHRFASLPARTEYRFTYQLDRDATAFVAQAKLGAVARGPDGSSASPMTLVTLDDPDIIAAVKAGAPDAEIYVQPGDAALVGQLDPLLAASDYSVAESAVRCVAATETPEAVDRLLGVLARSQNMQLRNVAANGFRKSHPRVRAPKLIEALAHEQDDGVAASIVLALGELDDPSLVPQLQVAHAARHRKPIDPTHPTWGADFAFELAGARLHDVTAVQALHERMRVASAAFAERTDALAGLFREAAYTHNPAVALLVTDFFNDNRYGARNKPYIDGPAPRNAREARALIDAENHAYERVADDALFAVLGFFPDEPWGIEPSLRRFTADEQRRVRAVVARRAKAP